MQELDNLIEQYQKRVLTLKKYERFRYDSRNQTQNKSKLL